MTNPVEQASASTLDTPIWVIVPAAGSGQRLGGEIAKQYQILDGVCMLKRSIDRLLDVPGVAGMVVVLASRDEHWVSLGSDADSRVHTTVGGSTRAESVLAGINYVLKQTPAQTWLMVHDAARPLVEVSDIQRLINVVYNNGAVGGLLATPVHDTLKKADDYATVVRTVEREKLWQAQTPQLFRAGELQGALSEAMRTHPDTITDEASAMEYAGHQPQLVEALQPNFKITRPVDWEMAHALLKIRRLSGESSLA
ncbi:MAG: 2-C-methyl-D-erythritol 4-phosphate cytidylyltransferase [Granulosicoccus sp.]